MIYAYVSVDKSNKRFTQNGYVYFMLDGFGHCKIGNSLNVMKRKKSLEVGCPYELEIIKIFKLPNKSEAEKIEKALHKKFKKVNIRGEWFEEKPVIDWLNQSKIYVEGYEFS